MAVPAVQFTEWPHVSYLRDYAKGFFNALIDISAPAEINHPEQYQRGRAEAFQAMINWAGPRVMNAPDAYLRRWEAMALMQASLERSVDKSLAHCIERTRKRQASLQHELDHHESRSHPTKDALRHLIARAGGELRQLTKEIAARKKNPYPCLACPAALLCRDQHLACNQYFRFATINEMSQQKRNNIPREDRKPTEETTMEKMPPSRYWHDLIFRGSK